MSIDVMAVLFQSDSLRVSVFYFQCLVIVDQANNQDVNARWYKVGYCVHSIGDNV